MFKRLDAILKDRGGVADNFIIVFIIDSFDNHALLVFYGLHG